MEPEKAWGGGNDAFGLNLEESIGIAPLEVDREEGISDRSVHIKML